jgi:glycosyltransferase involved in cell wall biosynthesis
MKIVIDLQSCQSGSRFGGIGRYTLQLAKAMAMEAGDDDVWVVLNNQLPSFIADVRNELSSAIPQSKIITFESIGRVGAHASAPSSFRTRAAELCREHFIAQMRPDVVYVASLFEGLAEDVVSSVANLQTDHGTAVTLYDLIPLVHQEMYLTNEISRTHYMSKLGQLTRADILLAISEFSRDQGRQLLHYPSDRIINMSSASGDYFRPVQMSLLDKQEILKRLGIKRKFLMYTGSFDQRKNQKNLIEAFSLLTPKIRADFQLVIVGNGWQGVYAELRGHAQNYGLKEDDVIFAGKVLDDDLLKLYNLCFLFVFPSLFEGFGLPILEAMSCGTPAIGSNSTSIPEVIGREDALFDPTSPSKIAAKISEVIASPSFYESLREHALIHAKKFSWERSARIALDAFREFVPVRHQTSAVAYEGAQARKQLMQRLGSLPDSNGNAEDSELELAGMIAINERLLEVASASKFSPFHIYSREHLGLVTTWGTKCGIAAYSKLLMKAMPLEFTVFAPFSDLLVAPDESNVQRCWSSGDSDNLSNLLQRIRKSQVTTVLFQVHYGFYNFDALASIVKALHEGNISVSIQLHSTSDPPEHILNKKLKSLVSTFNSCENIFVLTEVDVGRLEKLGVMNNVTLLPLGVHCPKATEVTYEKSGGDFLIASYGFFLPHKGIHELIRAFAKLKVEVPSVKLLLVNAEYPIPESRLLVEQAYDLISALGINNSVTLVTEYLSDEESVGYLSKADLIVYPYQHTTEPASAAVRLGIACGVPVAVTPINIFKDVQNMVHLLPGLSPDDIHIGLRILHSEILSKQDKISKVSLSGKRWLNIHNYANLSRYLFSMIAIRAATSTGFNSHLHFPATDPSLRTRIGKVSEFGLSSNRLEGVLLFGPYVTLEASSYKLSIFGASDAKDIWDAISLKLIYGDVSTELTYEVIPSKTNALLVELRFKLEETANKFEVQICVNSLHFVEIVDIVLSSNRRIH